NTGSGNSSGTTLADPIPAGTTYVAGSTTLNGAAVADVAGAMPYAAARTINSTGQAAGVIAAGATATVTFQVRVNTPAPSSITNTATVDVDGAGVSPPQTATATNAAVALAPTKTASPSGTVTAGQTITYTVTIPNNGSGNTAGTTLADPIPTGTTYVAGSTTLNGTAVADVSGAMPFASAALVNSPGRPAGQINAGEAATVTFRVTVNNPAPASLSNAATIDPDGGGPGPPQTITSTNTVARLAPTKTASPSGTVTAGQTITYTVSVPNTGSGNSSGTTLADPIPAGTTYVAGSTTLNGVAVADNGGMPFRTAAPVNSPGEPAGQVNAGETATVTFQVTVNNSPPASLSNAATVDVDGPGPAPAQTATTMSGVARLQFAKTANPPSDILAGETVTYTITMQNTGSGNSSGTTLADPIPAGTTYVPGSTTLNGATVTDNGGMPFRTAALVNSVGQAAGVIAAGATATVIFQVTANNPAPAIITNTATVDVDGGGPAPPQTATVQSPSTIADLAVAITDGQTIETPGSPISYTITVTNNGPDTVTSLDLDVTLPGSITSPTFTPSTGTYNSATGSWTGITLASGGSIVLTVAGTISPSASGTLTTTAIVSPPTGISDPNASNNTASDTDTVGVTVSGRVYNDANHNGVLDGGESGIGVAGLFAKLIPSAGGSAVQAAAVDPATGAYQFTGIGTGTYSIILDTNSTLTETTPSAPPGYVGTQPPNLVISSVVVANVSVPNQNFGLFNGSRLSGMVFNDNGAGGGTANDTIRNGGETGIAGVTVRAINAAGTVIFDTDVTDGAGSYTLYIPASASGTSVRITETNPPNFFSIGGQPGTTGGTYTRATDTLAFTDTAGVVYSGVNFADVPVNTFVPDNTRTAIAGSAVFYPHTFTAGSAGQVSFSTTNVPNPSIAGWSNTVHRDTNCNGVLDGGEVELTAPVTVVAGDQVCIIVRENIPASAPLGAQDTITVTANFTYANAASLTAAQTRTDVTTSAASGLELTKTVDKATAKPGEVITYTVTYRNISAENLNTLIITDTVPAFTTFTSATNGPLPANLTSVSLTSPSVGGTGQIRWTFTGSLAPGGSGTVTFRVTVR
ncbi:MAG: hypothetical protein M3347_15455, partial [Armatimonadota bacterium]|nr:hypothetical protein [Armatimonadota bacterium]